MIMLICIIIQPFTAFYPFIFVNYSHFGLLQESEMHLNLFNIKLLRMNFPREINPVLN